MAKISWWNLQLGSSELDKIQHSFLQKKISYNSVGHELEIMLARFLNVKHVLLTTSGSTSLLMALKAAGIGPGDEVIVPNRTFQATANAVLMAGAKVKLVDVDPIRATLSVGHLLDSIGPKTRAIIPVHLNGRACDLENLVEICRQKNLILIEDAAQAFGSLYKNQYLGTFGDIGCFSMGTTKFLTTGQGGFLTTNDSSLYEKARKFIFQGYEGEDDKKFNHLGFNFRLSDLLSSIAIPQLERIEDKKNQFLKVYNAYKENLKDSKSVKFLECRTSEGEIPIWVEVLSPARDKLFSFLQEKGIETYKFYPSLHRSPYLNQEKPAGNDFPGSLGFETKGLILPCGPHIDFLHLAKVSEEIHQFDKSL